MATYLWASTDGKVIGFGGDGELRAVLAAGYKPICLNLDGCLAAFVKAYPDQTRIFETPDLVEVTAWSPRTLEDRIAADIIVPDAMTRPRGHRVTRRWSWRGAFLAATLAALDRAGVSLPALAKIAAEINDARPRPAVERDPVPTGVS